MRQATGTFSRKRTAGSVIEGAPYRPGDLLGGRYLIRDAIAAGPIGFLFKAQDKEVDVEVALKVVSPRLVQSADERRVFAQEVRLARKLSHNNLVRVYEEGADGERLFFTMQYLDGLTLRRIIDLRREKGQTFALKEIEPIFAQIASGLDYAHKIGPHSDLKPENVIVLPDLLKLTDFGLGMAVPRQPFVQAQKASGGDRYLAPEYAAGEAVDKRADVYALGVILGEMLAGVFPDSSSTPELRSKVPELPVEIESVYRRATNANPASRESSVGELFLDLSRVVAIAEAPGPHRSPSSAGQPAAPRSKRPQAKPPPPPATTPSEPFVAVEAPSRNQEPAPPRPRLPPPVPLEPEATPPVPPTSHPTTEERLPRRDRPAPHERGPILRLVALAALGLAAGVGGGYTYLALARSPSPPASGTRDELRPPSPRPAPLGVPDAVSPPGPPAPIPAARPQGLRASDDARTAPEASEEAARAAEERRRAQEERAAEVARAAEEKRRAQEERAAEAARAAEEKRRAQEERAADHRVTDEQRRLDASKKADDAWRTEERRRVDSERRDQEKPLAEERRLEDQQRAAKAREDEERRRKEALEKAFAKKPDDARGPEVAAAATPAGAPAAVAASGCKPGMRLIGAGPFRMGTAKDDPMMGFDERELAPVELPAFCIDVYEFPNKAGAPPQTGVTLAMAEAACRGRGKRLCTEEEWEKACKGPAGARYPYGQAFDAGACSTEDASSQPRALAPAGSFARCRSGYGVYDLSGNAAEWTSSPYNPDVPDHATKGGAADRPDYDVRCAARKNAAPSSRNDKVGFRCCSDPG